MIHVLPRGIVGPIELDGWLTYEMREWWKEEGQQQYSYVHMLGDEGEHDFLIFWVWTWDEMYIGVLDSLLGEFVFTTIVEPQEKTDVMAFQQALDFIDRWVTGRQTEKELEFMQREKKDAEDISRRFL